MDAGINPQLSTWKQFRQAESTACGQDVQSHAQAGDAQKFQVEFAVLCVSAGQLCQVKCLQGRLLSGFAGGTKQL